VKAAGPAFGNVLLLRKSIPAPTSPPR